MKPLHKLILGSILLSSLPLAWIGCVGVAGSGEVVYGDGPWFRNDIWLDGGGRGWYGGNRGGAYVHPGGGHFVGPGRGPGRR